MGYPPSGVQKSRDISEHRGHSVASPVVLMVESSSSGGRGAEQGRPPPRIADVIDRQENIMHGMFSHTGTTPGEKGQDHEAPESCDKVQDQISNQPCGAKLPNGHAVTERDHPKSSHPAGSCLNSEDDCVIANGELLADSRGGALDAVASAPPPQGAAEDRTIWRYILVRCCARVGHAREHIVLFHARRGEPSAGVVEVLARGFGGREVCMWLRAGAWRARAGWLCLCGGVLLARGGLLLAECCFARAVDFCSLS